MHLDTLDIYALFCLLAGTSVFCSPSSYPESLLGLLELYSIFLYWNKVSYVNS